MRQVFVFLWTVAAVSLLAGTASAQRYDRDERARTFNSPRLDGYPLDICPRDVGLDGLLRGRCGIPVANEFCRERGFEEALDAPVRNNAGPTRFYASGEVCPHSWCASFRYITCGG